MNMFRNLTGAALLAAAIVSPSLAIAADDAKIDPAVTKLLKNSIGDIPVKVEKTPVEGLYKAQFGDKISYLTSDGRYLLIGDMIDLKSRENLTEVSRREIAKEAIAGMKAEDMAVFPAKGKTKTVLNVFTDTSCPYCQKLHAEVPKLQEAGIEVRYIPFPRGGSRGPGYEVLKQVWCAKDRSNGMDIAKEVASGNLPVGDCKDAAVVDAGYELGNKVGVTGTPALFAADGRKFDGYVPYQQLIPMLLNGS